MTILLSSADALSLIQRMLGSNDVPPEDQRAFLHDLRSSHRRVEWTPVVFDTLVAHCDTSSPKVVQALIFLAKDILRLRSYEAATRLGRGLN